MWVCSHSSQPVSYSFTLIVRSAFWKSLMLFIYLASFLFFILFFPSAQILWIFQLTHIWHWVRQTWFLWDFCMVDLIGIDKESKIAKNVARARRSVYFLWVVRVHSTIGNRFTIVSFSERCTYKILRLHVVSRVSLHHYMKSAHYGEFQWARSSFQVAWVTFIFLNGQEKFSLLVTCFSPKYYIFSKGHPIIAICAYLVIYL